MTPVNTVSKPLKITILTLFPEMFQGPFEYSIVKRAVEKKLVDIKIVNFRESGLGKHKIVDDAPYGGGIGMILRVDVLDKAINKIKLNTKKEKVVLLSPKGKTFNQTIAKEFANLDSLILICGHYEGVDARIENFIDEKISIGDFITTGGEIPAMLITDSVVRLIKGVLKDGATARESFPNLLEYDQYTRPNVYKNLTVPKILLSGDHKKIEIFKNKISNRLTKKLRPDLLKKEN